MKRNLFIMAIILLLAGAALYGNLGGSEVAKEERPEAGFQAPSFALQGLDGKTYDITKLDKPVIINFWASWCGPCRLEAPTLVNLHQKYGDQVEIWGVNLTMNDQLEKAQSFVDHFQFKFPIPMDTEGEVSKQYQVMSIPTTFFIDRHQTIVKVAVGLHSQEEMEQVIEQLINTP